MNDYKELVEKFRAKRNDGWQKDGSYQEQIITVQDILEAADAIEQLVKERDDNKEKSAQWRRDYLFLMEQNEELYKEFCKVRKERDAAVADIEEVIHDDLSEICTICNKHKSCMKTTTKTPLAKLPCERGKWRGVKEDNSESSELYRVIVSNISHERAYSLLNKLTSSGFLGAMVIKEKEDNNVKID